MSDEYTDSVMGKINGDWLYVTRVTFIFENLFQYCFRLKQDPIPKRPDETNEHSFKTRFEPVGRTG